MNAGSDELSTNAPTEITREGESGDEPSGTESGVPNNKTVSLSQRQQLLALIGICAIGFFLADIATPACFEEPFPAMLALGVVTAQLTVICVWGTLVRGTFWVRLPWTLLLLTVSWCGFVLGMTLSSNRYDTDSMLGSGVIWAFGFITSFVPLKIAALCFRWQIIQRAAGPETKSGSGYAIRDIMIGTSLLAMTMAIGRVMLPDEDVSLARAIHASGLDDGEPLFAITLYGVISLLVKLPCIWIALGEESGKIGGRVAQWVGYCFALSVFEVFVLIAVLGSPGNDMMELWAGMILSHQLMGGIMLGVCLALRGLGYRLQRSLSNESDAAPYLATLVPESESS